MIYFVVKDKIEHMTRLLALFEAIREVEKKTRSELVDEGRSWLGPYGMLKDIREEAALRDPSYSVMRTDFARMIPRANELCEEESISWQRVGLSAPMEGGAKFQGSIFDLVLNRPSDLLDIDSDVRDTVNKCIGSLEDRRKKEFRQLINPFYWVRQIVVFVIRLPYLLIEASGFDVAKIEDHFLGKLAHLIYVILLVLVLLWFGIDSTSDLVALLLTVIKP